MPLPLTTVLLAIMLTFAIASFTPGMIVAMLGALILELWRFYLVGNVEAPEEEL